MGHSINAATIIGITTFFLVLCTAFTVIRFYERIHRQQQLWWDDCECSDLPSLFSSDTSDSGTMLLAWVATVALCLLQFLMLRDGAGVDVSRVPESQFKEFSMV